MKRTKVFVFDTNTLISAFLVGSHTNNMAFIKALDTGRIVISRAIIQELTEVFMRKKFDKYATLEERIKILSFLDKQIMKWPEPIEAIVICRDPKDNKYLELAASAKASCIITGDKDLLILHPFGDIPILTAADFLKSF